MRDDQLSDPAIRLTTESERERPLTVARLTKPKCCETTTFAVVSDPHVTPTDWGSWKVYHRTEQRLRTAIDDITERQVDHVLMTGDLTKDGTVNEFHRVTELLNELDANLFAIPGNHDVPKSFDTHVTPPLESFVRRYSGGELPFVRRVGDVDVVGLNSVTETDGSLINTHGGRISDAQLSWLADTLPELECPIVAVHHNLTRRTDEDTPAPTPIYQLDNAAEFEAVLSRCDVELVLAGHTHCPAVGSFDGGREVVVPATCSFPQAYTLVHVSERGTEIQLVPLTDSAGLREAQTHALEADRSHLVASAVRDYPIVDEWTERRRSASPRVRK